MELFGYGAVVVVDTAGLDDDTSLGQKRVKASLHALTQMDLAVLVVSENKFEKMNWRNPLLKNVKSMIFLCDSIIRLIFFQ